MSKSFSLGKVSFFTPPYKEMYEKWGIFLLYNIQNVPLMACTNLSVEQQSDRVQDRLRISNTIEFD